MGGFMTQDSTLTRLKPGCGTPTCCSRMTVPRKFDPRCLCTLVVQMGAKGDDRDGTLSDARETASHTISLYTVWESARLHFP